MKKKKILFHSNWSKSKTGFGRHSKALLRYLYSTGKYDIVEFATGCTHNHPELKNMPWECKGSLPDTEQEWRQIFSNLNAQDQHIKRRAVNYGDYHIDTMIKEHKPDVYIGTEDIWAFTGFFERVWWNKINCMIHTTLDSLPILPDAVESANYIKNYFVWAKFAEEAMHKLGHNHVKTIHGAIETEYFYKLEEEKRLELRNRFGIPKDAFVIGFVFRNQLRKSVVNLLQGFKKFCQENPESNAYLLLHTHWNEPNGWNIPQRIKEVGVDPSRVLTTYICRNCLQYEVKPFQIPKEHWGSKILDPRYGENQDCRFCGAKKAQVTTSTQLGVSESQLNEIYNLMDVYCHPFTSGGQEIPVQEAKLTEIPTLVTNYSCGEEYCLEENGGLPLSWEEYREVGTEFIKATTKYESIASQLRKVYKMSKQKKEKFGKLGRDFVLNNIDVSVVGKQFEDIIDNLPEVDWDWDFSEPPKNPNYVPEETDNDVEWVKSLYRNILLLNAKDDDKGLVFWLQELRSGNRTKEQVLNYFRNIAIQENNKQKTIELKDLFEDTGRKKGLIVLRKSIGDAFMLTSLFKSFHEQYPEHDLYIATSKECVDVFIGNPYVYKVLDYQPVFEHELAFVGQGGNEKIVDVYMYPAIASQKHYNYLSNNNPALISE